MRLTVQCFLCAVCIVVFTVYSYGQAGDKIDWKQDLDYVKTELPKLHYNLFFKISQAEFNAGMDDLISAIPKLSDQQIAIRLKQIVARVGDSHTNVSVAKLFDKKSRLPLNSFWFKEGIFIIGAQKAYQELNGQQIISINNIPIKVITDSLSTLYANENNAVYKWMITEFITHFSFLRYFEFVKGDSLIMEVMNDNAVKSSHVVRASEFEGDWLQYETKTIPLYQKFCDIYYGEEYIRKDSIYFIQYNDCWSRELEMKYGKEEKAKELPSFVEFENRVYNVLQSKPVKKLVVDLRFNDGGASYQGTQFIERLSRFREINQKGKIYVIVGRKTFSSAIINVMDFKRLTPAIFVGEETAGKPNHFGEIKRLKLPSSNLDVAYSTKLFKRSEENASSFVPDHICEVTFEDYKNGVDKAMDFIVKE
ncbi:MAG TPA: S41 family peptidase [Bacteroidia bacterium]|nr:S41 family peptidase [Bacteroidia bacterium]